MNIREAKEQITNTIAAYLARDELGNLKIPVEKQRPIFLMGPPGIGKTAIVEQAAAEAGIGLVSYSITHHTRQSALGLPFIVKRTYGGKEYDISEYTMSEIIASVWECMEETGVQAGILFLDEINCVSETLAPVMLQFLQYKMFGRHRVPENWVVVTAGNTAAYNTSVREFDIVTWDRLKRIDIQPDYDAWREYALSHKVHPAILTYLNIRKNDFYHVETNVDGKRFVTARGWEDLSRLIWLYEEKQIPVTESLVAQYLQDPKTAKNFTVYYDLFRKYQEDYHVEEILSGTAPEDIHNRAKKAAFDERLALLGLLLDAVGTSLRNAVLLQEEAGMLADELKQIQPTDQELDLQALDRRIQALEESTSNSKQAAQTTEEKRILAQRILADLQDLKAAAQNGARGETAVALRERKLDELDLKAETAKQQLTNLFQFVEKNYGDGQEMLILVTELSLNRDAVRFIARWGCPEYFAHNGELKFYERQRAIDERLKALDIGKTDGQEQQ